MGRQTNTISACADGFEFVEADALSVDVVLKQLLPNLESLKTSVDCNLKAAIDKMGSSNESLGVNIVSINNNLKAVEHAIQSSKEDIGAKIIALSKDVASIKVEVANMNTRMLTLNNDINVIKHLSVHERKQRTLDRALGLTHLGSFNYWEGPLFNHGPLKSSDLAKRVIGWLLLGQGDFLPEASLTLGNSHIDSEREDAKKSFREKFKKQIKDLIQREPRLVESSEMGKYVIYYE